MNSKWHLYLSLLKSFIRIGTYIISFILLVTKHIIGSIIILCIGSFLAEVLGVAEEIKDYR
jgi:hypothetical protein